MPAQPSQWRDVQRDEAERRRGQRVTDRWGEHLPIAVDALEVVHQAIVCSRFGLATRGGPLKSRDALETRAV